MTVFLLLFMSSLSVAHAKKNSNYSKKHSVSAKKGNTPPKRKIAKEVNAIEVSAYYTPYPGQPDYFNGSFKKERKINGGKKTRTGKTPEKGMIAVDPKVIPLRHRVFIPELELYLTTEDTGGDVKGKHIDIYAGEGYAGLKEVYKIAKDVKENGKNNKVTVVILGPA